ncbi:MAG: hypothetical protein QM796_05465 [Chthoniobacteraceae bacterium]
MAWWACFFYTKLVSGNLETHFIQTSNDFSSITETTLSRFTNGDPASVFDPYIGDYEDLVAVGTTFYGTFSASNNTSLFPTQPTFLRDSSLLGSSVNYSIDPFFFKVTTVSSFYLSLRTKSARPLPKVPDASIRLIPGRKNCPRALIFHCLNLMISTSVRA